MNKNLMDRIKHDQCLKGHTTFKVGGTATLFAEPTNQEEFQEVLDYGRAMGLRIFVLGKGSNILVKDGGVEGLVVHIPRGAFNRAERRGEEILAEAGVSLPLLIQKTVEWELKGLETLVGIPGSVGGAVAMNAGGKYGTIDRWIEEVSTIGYDGTLHRYKREEVNFQYRNAGLEDEIVLETRFRLEKGSKEEILQRMKEIYEEKRRTQPLSSKSAGCVFKNPMGQSAGALIDQAGLKGFKVGGAMVSRKHANFIINWSYATASHVLELIQRVREEVKRRFGVWLEMEIKVW
jgi:UDP-N-acetylmuramate dehydrogenase